MSPSIKDVAKKANVSTATVSHVINGTRYVSETTKIKVLQAMKELDYQPNLMAKSLRSRKSKIIGLIVPMLSSDTSNFFFMSIANGIENVLKEHGYNLILSNSHENLQTELEQIKVFNSQLIDGLIIAPTAKSYNHYKEVMVKDYPVVFIDRKPSDYSGDFVLADSYKGANEAVKHMIEKGHKRISFVTGHLGITTSDDRLTGYKEALVENNIEIDPNLIIEGGPSFEEGYRITKQLVEESRTTALFIANNMMTLGALRYLNKHNIKIPDEIAVVGFDDYEWMRIISPPLSVVKQPSYKIGEHAVRILLNRINDGVDIEHEHVILPTRFVSRDSV